ncbi:hypothetical protein PQX77_018084 [Marasmius sp. AFHP31]|nr:hypothetical protein PQX77_018084 [Marasmius sp. AFHP31]
MAETGRTRSKNQNTINLNVKDKFYKPTLRGKKSAKVTGTENRRQAQAQDRQEPAGTSLRRLGILEMPLEIVIEIFAYVDPHDLLSLSRTTRHIRSFLLSRSSSKRLWKSALTRIKPPLPLHSVPSTLNEPQLAALIFDLRCHTCGEVCEGNEVFWACKVACCGRCTSKLFSPITEILRNKPRIGRDTKKAIESVLPFRVYNDSRFYIPSMVNTSLRAYHESKGNTDKMKEWERNVGHPKLFDFEVLTDKMSKWWDEVPKERARNILSRLKSHGWTTDELHHYALRFSFDCIRLLTEKKLLDEQNWHEIHPQLTQVLTQIRVQRSQALRETVYSERTRLLYDVYRRYTATTLTLAPTFTIPWGDFILTPEASPLNDMIYHTAVDTPVAEDTLVRVLEGIDLVGVGARWVRRLELSSAHSEIWRLPMPEGWKYGEYHNPFDASWVVTDGLYPWDPSRVEIHANATEVVKRLMDACGVDTVEELADEDPLVECQTCDSSIGLLRWTEAITHCERHGTHTFTIRPDVDKTQFYNTKLRSESGKFFSSLGDISCHLSDTPLLELSHMETEYHIDPSEVTSGFHWMRNDD